MTTKYYAGTSSTGSPQWAYWDVTQSQWVLTATPPGLGDDGILGGPQPTPPGGGAPLPQTLPQSGTVSFSGLTTTDVGELDVDGTGPWTIVGTGGTNSTINSLVVTMGATVTVAPGGAIAVKNVVIQQTPGITTPATVTLGDGLAPGDAIDFQNQPGLTYTSAFDGTHTNIIVSSGSTVVGNVSLMGNAQLGPATGDGAGGTEIVVQGTQPVIGTLATNTPYLILNISSANDIGASTSEIVIMGDVDVRPNGYQGTTVSAASITNPSTGQPYSVLSVPFTPSADLANQFNRRVAYDPNNPADAYLIQPWTLTFKNGTATETVTTPSLVGATLPPFASNVTFSGSSANPTFTWTYPAGSINGVFFDIFDDTGSLSGGADLVYSASILGNTGTFTVPNALAGGLTLQQGHHYTLDLYGIISRDPTQPLSNANSLAWSQSFFDFEPITGATVPNVYLPTITPAGAYQFTISVIAGQTYFIDPSIATGYTYATGAGNPNFASVLLPAIQTTPYTVSFINNGVQETDTVAPNTLFTFPNGGVSTFTVTGVNVADDLNPANATAFVTGLTFVSSGSFTGTQTPIVVSEPGPTAGSASITVGHNQTLDETALVNGLITPGLPGDTETVILVTGNATLSGSTITYNSPATGTDSFTYTVRDELSDTATGTVNVTIDPGPTITSVAGVLVGSGQTAEIGTVAPGLAGDTLTLKQTGGSGAVSLQLVNGTEEVMYTAPSDVTPDTVTQDTVSYTITDQLNDVTASGPVSVTLDTVPPAVAIANGGGLTNAASQTISGTVTATEAAPGATVTLYDNGSEITTAPVAANGTWSAQVTLSGDGTHAIVATDTDAAGNTGASTPVVFILDTVPPIIAAPTATTVQQGQATPISGVSLSDAEGFAGEAYSVTLSDANGVLAASGSGVSGSGTTSLTISGSLSQVNADLATLTDTDASSTADTIKISASDNFGNPATQQSIAITVQVPSYWANPFSGSWYSANDWQPKGVPGAGNQVLIDVAGQYAVTIPANRSPTVATLSIGNANAILNISAGSILSLIAPTQDYNAGTINLIGKLSVNGATFDNAGKIDLVGGTISGGVLQNALGGSIAGAGTIGNSGNPMILDNQGTIEGIGSLTLNTGGNAITNTGLLGAEGGTLTIDSAVTGIGIESIGGLGAIEFKGAVSNGQTTYFDNPSNLPGALILDHTQSFAGTVADFVDTRISSDALVLEDIRFNGKSRNGGVSWTFTENQQGTGGLLTVSDQAGDTAKIALLGQYLAAGLSATSASSNLFVVSADHIAHSSGTEITTNFHAAT